MQLFKTSFITVAVLSFSLPPDVLGELYCFPLFTPVKGEVYKSGSTFSLSWCVVSNPSMSKECTTVNVSIYRNQTIPDGTDPTNVAQSAEPRLEFKVNITENGVVVGQTPYWRESYQYTYCHLGRIILLIE